MRVENGGSHTFTVGNSFPIVTAPAAQNINLDYIFVGVSAALGAGVTVQVEINGITLAVLTIVVPQYLYASPKFLVVPATKSLAIVASVAIAAPLYYGYAGEQT